MHLGKGVFRDALSEYEGEVDDNNGFGNLVPVTLNLEIEGKRLKEIFLWDKNESLIQVESFAKMLIDDHNLTAAYEGEIIASIKKQLSAFRAYKPVDGEVIRIIKLNVRIGNIIVRDQFEWDINNPSNSPEVRGVLKASLGVCSMSLRRSRP